MKRKIFAIFMFLMLAISTCFMVACGPEEDGKVTVEFTQDMVGFEATQNAVCDLAPYVKKVDGCEYSLIAYQLDTMNDFAMVELETDGLTFTPILYDDAYVTVCATKGGKTYESEEITVIVVLPRDEMIETFVKAWHDPMFTSSVCTDSEFIYGDCVSSAKYKFFGSEPSYEDRWQYFATINGDYSEYYSVTDWSDAVLSFWVYNPTEYDIEISPIWSHSASGFIARRDPRTFRYAKAGEWTEIKYSLRYFNMLENFFFDADVYYSYITDQVEYGIGIAPNGKPAINHNWWTCRWVGRKPINKVYGYEFYLCGYDIRDYDPVRDADLDHTLNGAKADYYFSTDDTPYALPGIITKQDQLKFEVWAPNAGTSKFEIMSTNWGDERIGPFFFDVRDPSKNSLGVTVTKKSTGTDLYDVTIDLRYGGGSATKDTELNGIYWNGGYVDTYFKNLTIVKGDEIVVEQGHENQFILSGDKDVFEASDAVKRNDTIKFYFKLNDDTLTTGKFGFMLFDGTDWHNYLKVQLKIVEGNIQSDDGAVVSVTRESASSDWFLLTLDLSKVNKVTNEGQPASDNETWLLKKIYTDSGYTDCAIYLDGFSK